MNARDRILGAPKSAPTPFKLGEETLFIRKPTVADTQRIQARTKSGMDDTRVGAFAIVDFVVDAEGKAVFKNEDVDALLGIEVDVFKAISKAVVESMTGIPERAAKNSETTPSASSSTP